MRRYIWMALLLLAGGAGCAQNRQAVPTRPNALNGIERLPPVCEDEPRTKHKLIKSFKLPPADERKRFADEHYVDPNRFMDVGSNLL
jgi:hypothetical protein